MSVAFMRGDGGYDWFRITYQAHQSGFDARVDEVIAWPNDGTYDDECFDRYLSCTIKWDSCSHFTFGDGDGYLHLCGVHDFQKHARLMEFLYRLAFEAMGRDPEPDETWKG